MRVIWIEIAADLPADDGRLTLAYFVGRPSLGTHAVARHQVDRAARGVERRGVLVHRQKSVPLEPEGLGRPCGELFPEVRARDTQLDESRRATFKRRTPRGKQKA